jgi:hypothetical protein
VVTRLLEVVNRVTILNKSKITRIDQVVTRIVEVVNRVTIFATMKAN